MAPQYTFSALTCSFEDANQPSLMHSTWKFPSQRRPGAIKIMPLGVNCGVVGEVPPNLLDPITTSPSKPTHAVQEISLSALSPAFLSFDSILCEWNGCGAIISNDNNEFAEHLVQQHDIPMCSRSETSTTPCFWKDCCEDQERWVVDDLASIVLHIEQDHLGMHRVRCPICWKALNRSAFKFHARADHPAVEVVP